MTKKLQSVRVQRFKCIADAPFDLGAVNVLVGANNSGKSSIIQALHFAIGALQTMRLEHKLTAEQTGKISTSLSPEQLIYSPSKTVAALAQGGRLIEPEKDAICTTFTLTDGTQCTVTVRKGRNRNILVAADNSELAFELANLENPFRVVSPGLAGIAKEEQYVSDGVLLRTIARGDANLVLRNTLLRLWDTSKWTEFLADLRELFPDLSFELLFNTKTDEYITAFVERDGTKVPFELAGTGLLQAAQILSYIHQFAPAMVVLDEPDSHLHPNDQRLLCTLLQKVAEERNTQVVLTTHSRHVVDAIGSASKFLWVRNGTVDEAQPDDEIGILLDIGALDVKERTGQPGTRAVVLTEDKTIRPLNALLESSGFNFAETVILPYYGCTNPGQLRPLVRLIRSTNTAAKIVVHRDRDYLLPEEVDAWSRQIRELQVEPFLTVGIDIESHFLDAAHLASINNGVSAERFQTMLQEARDDLSEACVEKYVNGRLDILRKAGKAASTNVGKLASDAPKAIAEAPARFAHGKLSVGTLRRIYKEQVGMELRLFHPSEHVVCDSLKLVAKKAFGQTNAAN